MSRHESETMRGMQQHLRPQRGQSVVEFAFASIVILLLIFGTIDLGRAVFTRVMVANAVREAGRYAMISPGDSSGILAAAQQRSPTLGLTSANITVTCSYYDTDSSSPTYHTWQSIACNSSDMQPGYRVTVQMTYTFSLTAGRLIGFRQINMGEQAQVRVQ
ncbi:MAG TPA: TadE/TadG family type IV pilus assembly protein [Thermomicrobiales bacterium]|nr:TadE/TadG family type IV pilus assembly protein [Thermomicrobiales bacterium]